MRASQYNEGDIARVTKSLLSLSAGDRTSAERGLRSVVDSSASAGTQDLPGVSRVSTEENVPGAVRVTADYRPWPFPFSAGAGPLDGLPFP